MYQVAVSSGEVGETTLNLRFLERIMLLLGFSILNWAWNFTIYSLDRVFFWGGDLMPVTDNQKL